MPEIISRKMAKSLGLKKYFTGKPCKYGHVADRYFDSGMCTECRYHTKKSWQIRNPEKALRYGSQRRAAILQSAPPWLSAEHCMAIDAIYRDAKDREELIGGKWHVDHIFPLQSDFGCGLHVPWNLCVVPESDNCGKSNKLPDEIDSFWHDFAGKVPPFKRIDKSLIINALNAAIQK